MNLRRMCMSAVGLMLAAGSVLAQSAPAPAAPAAPAKEAAKPAADLPTAKAVIDRYIEAIGGRANMEKAKSRKVTMTVDMPAMGMKGDSTMMQAEGGKFRNSMELAGMGKIEQGSDGTVFWDMNPMAGARVLEGEELAMMRRTMIMNPELAYDTLYKTMTVVGVEPVNDRPHYKLELTPHEGSATTQFFDVETGLLNRSVMTLDTQMGKVPATSDFSDYKDADGVKIPFKTTQSVQGMVMTMTVKEVKNNPELPADAFALPEEVKKLVAAQKTAPKDEKKDEKKGG